MKNLRKKLKSIPRHIWLLLLIIVIGIFLRTWQLHNWLDFGSDQVNDATRVGDVITEKSPWPLLGPDMSNSGSGGRETRFHLGPMYYYFEITSAKIFGNYPDRMAYPDTLFSILSIPLFYLFFKRYFSPNLSLAITALYTISFYVLEFSHSAWNPNSIPFFVMLFLLSLHELLVKKEKTDWWWVALAGISIGVGIQLHAILLVLLPATAFFVFLYLFKKNQCIWKKLTLVVLIAIIANFGQIISEYRTGFNNTKIFFYSLNNQNHNGTGTLGGNFIEDANCHIQANGHILTSLGKDDCTFLTGIKWKKTSWLFRGDLLLCLLFSLFGYWTLIHNWRREKEKGKKYFLALLALYIPLSFLVLLPVIDVQLRYFLHAAFIPFIFLGFLVEWLAVRFPRKNLQLAVIIFCLIALANIISLYPIAYQYATGSRSSPEAVVLGDVELMSNYMIGQAYPQKEAYLFSDANHSNFFKSFIYVGQKKNFIFFREYDDKAEIPSGTPIFYITYSTENDAPASINNKKVEDYKNFGQVGIFQLEN